MGTIRVLPIQVGVSIIYGQDETLKWFRLLANTMEKFVHVIQAPINNVTALFAFLDH